MGRVEIREKRLPKKRFRQRPARLANTLDDALYTPVRDTPKSEPVRKRSSRSNKSGGSGYKKRAPAASRGSPSGRSRSRRLADLDAGPGSVRPLVLIGVAIGADERRGRPRALVVGLVAGAVPPGGAVGIGHRLAGLVADEVLLVLHRRPAGDGAAAAARIRLDGVPGVMAASAEVAVIGAVGQARTAAGGAGAARGIRGARDHHLIDRVGVEGVARQVLVDLALDDGVGDVGRRRRGVEPVGRAAAEVGQRDGAVAAAVLRDGVVLGGGAELVPEGLQR